MQCTPTQPGPGDLARCLDAARSRPCVVCGASPDGVLRRCAERFQDTARVLVVARGARNELAFVPVFWDGENALGCVDLDALFLVRPAPLCGLDQPVERVVEAAGARLRLAGSYEDPVVKDRIQAAGAVLAWDAAQVWPVVDASVLLETPAPRRTWVEPGAPRYGRWPAPWLHWCSLALSIPWSEPPFSRPVSPGSAGTPAAALAAVGLPALGADAPPLAKALVLAALLRSVPWRGERRTLGARLFPIPPPAMALLGLCRGEAYRPGPDSNRWEPLFADGPIDRPIGLRELELAAGHLRLADAVSSASGPRDRRGAGQ